MVGEPSSDFGNRPVRVLAVTWREDSHQTIRDLLDAAPHVRFTLDRVFGLTAALARLDAGEADVCLIEGDASESLELLRLAQGRSHAPPIVMLANGSTIEVDLQAMALGVSDFLDRSRLDPLVLERTIRHAITRRQQAERLSRLAQHDPLTGLANRTLFRDRLERALAWARRRERLVAVMILDLNRFKTVNDRLGHAAGDRLLVIMAKRMTRRLRETDTVARLGGDEFALVIENLAQPSHAALVARKILDAIAPPVTLDGEVVEVTGSLGMALYPKDAIDGESLVRQADRAMYRAKAEGGNLFRFASDQLERRVQRGALLEADLRRALERGELQLHFQPQVGLSSETLGVAALIRWAHPELGLIGPERFLRLAEDIGLLQAVTEWLLEAACRQAVRWQDLDNLHLAVPLWSRQQLLWGDLVEQLDERFRQLSLTASSIEIELAEELLLADAEAGGTATATLHEIGVRLALDGYGRGPTSLKGLQLPALTTVKLARELLHDVPEDPRRSALLEAIVTLARELELRVVAEGVEREAQLAFLRRHRCDAVQGFMSCPPLPVEACTRWLNQAVGRRSQPPKEGQADSPSNPSAIERPSPHLRAVPSGPQEAPTRAPGAGATTTLPGDGETATRSRPSRLAW